MQVYLLTVVARDEAEAFVFVEEPDLAGWHAVTLSPGVFEATPSLSPRSSEHRVLPGLIGIVDAMSSQESTPSRLERTLAYLALVVIAIALASFFATMIAALAGVSREILAIGFWPVVAWIGYVGLPIGFLLIIALLLVTRHRRKQEYLREKR